MVLAVVAAVYDAVAANDFEQVVRLVTEDFVFELGGTSRFAGRHEGRDAFFALQADLVAATGIENEVVAIHDIPAGAIVNSRGRGRDGYADEALLLMSVSAGKVTAAKEFLFEHGQTLP